MFPLGSTAAAQQSSGTIRGVVYDKDFDVPLAEAQVMTVETGQRVTTTDQGNYVFTLVPPGKYTLIFTKDGYVRQVKADVIVIAGQLTDVDVSLSGEFAEMDEFLVQDILQMGAGTEAALLKLRFESPALMDSVGADQMSRAGAGDAATGLRLVAGASVQNGKYAVIRGLPDRYVNSQMNGVRLPSADEDKRAVELDQFPAAVIESIQVSKTFMPDQQGDASGGAVNVRLKGIPDENILQFKQQVSYNSEVSGRHDFLTYDGGGVGAFGYDNGDRDQQLDKLGQNWDGAAGVERGDAPINWKWSGSAGGKHDLGDGVKIGGFASLYYERGSYFRTGFDDSYWVEHPGARMTPQTNQGTPQDGDFKTALFDVEQSAEWVRWGGLATLGIESENHSLSLVYLQTRVAQDTTTLAEDTRGKEYFFPGYDPNDPQGPGNTPGNLNAAPYLRLETLDYTERTTGTLQLSGKHKLPMDEFGVDGFARFHKPELDWTIAKSTSSLDQPDKRQFGSLWLPASFHPGAPPFIPPFTTPPTWLPYKPGANFNLGNFQRIWKTIDEESTQAFANLKLPFEQWSGNEGYLKFGFFIDKLTRDFNQDTFSNFGDSGASFLGNWDEYWSAHFPGENHPISASNFDVDYEGKQDITAGYGMIDLPVSGTVNLLGGARYETTSLEIVNFPESGATWFPPGATAPVALNPGDADVSIHQNDLLPALGVEYRPVEAVTLRGSFSQTIARQTFKEMTPIIQQEFLGGPIFIGNPELETSNLDNYDLRCDYAPYAGGLVSASWFYKQVDKPIEYVQRLAGFVYKTPINYPKGKLSGYELEVRQDLGHFTNRLSGLAVGANGTLIDSDVSLPQEEIDELSQPGIAAPMTHRDMTNAPEYLYNLFMTYDVPHTGTQCAVFYTMQGDTLVAGAATSNGNFIPSIYALAYDTLNLSLSQRLGKYCTLQLQVKNLTNAPIEEVYRSPYIGGDVKTSSYTKGVEYSLNLGVTF